MKEKIIKLKVFIIVTRWRKLIKYNKIGVLGQFRLILCDFSRKIGISARLSSSASNHSEKVWTKSSVRKYTFKFKHLPSWGRRPLHVPIGTIQTNKGICDSAISKSCNGVTYQFFTDELLTIFVTKLINLKYSFWILPSVKKILFKTKHETVLPEIFISRVATVGVKLFDFLLKLSKIIYDCRMCNQD